MFDHDYFSVQTGYHEYKVFLFKHFCLNGAKNKAKKNTWLLFIWEFDLKYHYLFELIYGPEFSVEEEQIIYGDISLGLKEFFQ